MTVNATQSDRDDAGRYLLHEEIARGGMGIIHRAFDKRLGREVALKVEQQQTNSNNDRFENEMRIAGRMQHPSVVPVYDSGSLADGRRFLAMKLINGKTLKALISQSDWLENLPNFLRTFEQVCQAVGYAHSQNIVHRDLKPANIMVGEFGEVQVMDWGLAKDLTQSDSELSATESAEDRSEQDETRAGTILGTPQFMAPEQALGDLGQIDARTDVYCLGGILCYLLTGKPPNSGRTTNAMLDAAIFNDENAVAERLNIVACDEQLKDLVRQTLSRRPSDRPENGTVVAEKINQYLNQSQQRARVAEIQAAELRTQAAEQKRRQAVILTSAITVGLLAIAAITTGWWGYSTSVAQKARTSSLESQVLAGISQAKFYLEQIENQSSSRLRLATLENARSGVEQTRLLANDPLVADDVKQRFYELDERATLKTFDENLARDLESTLDGFRLFRFTFSSTGNDPEQNSNAILLAFGKHDLDPINEPERFTECLAPLSRRTKSFVVDSLDQLRQESAKFRNQHETPIASLLLEFEIDEWRQKLSRAISERDQATLRDLASAAEMEVLPPSRVTLLANWLNYFELKDARQELLRNGVQRNPGHFLLNSIYATSIGEQSPVEALRYYHVAFALRPNSAMAAHNLAHQYMVNGNREAAESYARKVIELDPDHSWGYGNYANLLLRHDKLEEGIRLIRTAVENARFSAAEGHEIIGSLLNWDGQPEAALKELALAIELEPNRSQAFFESAIASQKLGQPEKYEQHLRHTIKLRSKHGQAWFRLGCLLLKNRMLPESIAALQKATEILPTHAESFCNLGHALKRNGQFREAIAPMKRGHELGSRRSDWKYNSELWLKEVMAGGANKDELKKYLAQNPTSLRAQEFTMLAENCERRQEFTLALQFYSLGRQAKSSSPAHQRFLLGRIWRTTRTLFEKGNREEIQLALNALTEAAEHLIQAVKTAHENGNPLATKEHTTLIEQFRQILYWLRENEDVQTGLGELDARWQQIETDVTELSEIARPASAEFDPEPCAVPP